MLRQLRLAAVFAVIIAAGMPALGAAQSERGTISGIVLDGTKAALPGVLVTITNTATNQTSQVVSSAAGSYSVANLPPGTYRVEAVLEGFRTLSIANVQLSAGATTRVDLAMELGGVGETLKVVADATYLQTDDARVATTVSNQLIDELPLVVGGAMRSVFDLVSTVAETKGTGASVSIGGGQGGGYSRPTAMPTRPRTRSSPPRSRPSPSSPLSPTASSRSSARPLAARSRSLRSRERISSRARCTSSCATNRSTRGASSPRGHHPFTTSITTGPQRAGPCGVTRRSSSRPTKASSMK